MIGIGLKFNKNDMWIGAFWSSEKEILYVCLLPMLPVEIRIGEMIESWRRKRFGNRLSEMRLSSGKTVGEVAWHMGWAGWRIRDLEGGKERKPKRAEWDRLIEFLSEDLPCAYHESDEGDLKLSFLDVSTGGAWAHREVREIKIRPGASVPKSVAGFLHDRGWTRGELLIEPGSASHVDGDQIELVQRHLTRNPVIRLDQRTERELYALFSLAVLVKL